MFSNHFFKKISHNLYKKKFNELNAINLFYAAKV